MPVQYPFEVTPEEALRRCEEESADIPQEMVNRNAIDTESFIGLGQERFFSAIRAGILMEDPYANVYVPGLAGHRGFSVVENAVKTVLEEAAQANVRHFLAPRDWCYVHNFKNSCCPMPVSFPQGEGRVFKEKIAALRTILEKGIRRAMQSKDIRDEHRRHVQERRSWLVQKKEEFEKEARARGFTISDTSDGGTFPDAVGFAVLSRKKRKRSAPARMQKTEYNALTDEEKKEITRKELELTALAESIMLAADKKADETVAQINKREKRAVDAVITRAFRAFRGKDFSSDRVPPVAGAVAQGESASGGQGNEPLTAYLRGLKEYARSRHRIFLEKDNEGSEEDDESSLLKALEPTDDPFLPWKVNLFVDNAETDGAPLVARSISSIEEFAGNLNTRSFLGGSQTDHTRLEAGFAAQANGGVLILDADDLLAVPGLWDTVKKYVRNQRISFETVETLIGADSPSMRPQPIPLTMRVVLFGSSELLERIAEYDDDFTSFFKIRAEALPFVERTREEVAAYSGWFRGVAKEELQMNLSREGAARLIEHAGRLAGHQERLSTDLESLHDVLDEAALGAKKQERDCITAADVTEAIGAKIWRSDFFREIERQWIRDKKLLVAVSGIVVGQINGLVVFEEGGLTFGAPVRLAARTSCGAIGVVNIQHKAGLDGEFLKKADHTVRGLLKARFAQEHPLALEIYFSFEQAYCEVNGDSASMAQYLVMLSSISGIPLRQSIAITGSLDLLGNVQPIGGVNDKVAGFFRVCERVGELSGEQGVIIPWQNKKELMLPEDVVAAIRAEKFHVWAVATLDEAVRVLTGEEPAEVERKAKEQLLRYFHIAQKFPGSKCAPPEEDDKE